MEVSRNASAILPNFAVKGRGGQANKQERHERRKRGDGKRRREQQRRTSRGENRGQGKEGEEANEGCLQKA